MPKTKEAPSKRAMRILSEMATSKKGPKATLISDVIPTSAPERMKRYMHSALGLAKIAGDWRGANEFLPKIAAMYREIEAKAREMAEAIEALAEEVANE
jgi:hypothetical protein